MVRDAERCNRILAEIKATINEEKALLLNKLRRAGYCKGAVPTTHERHCVKPEASVSERHAELMTRLLQMCVERIETNQAQPTTSKALARASGSLTQLALTNADAPRQLSNLNTATNVNVERINDEDGASKAGHNLAAKGEALTADSSEFSEHKSDVRIVQNVSKSHIALLKCVRALIFLVRVRDFARYGPRAVRFLVEEGIAQWTAILSSLDKFSSAMAKLKTLSRLDPFTILSLRSHLELNGKKYYIDKLKIWGLVEAMVLAFESLSISAVAKDLGLTAPAIKLLRILLLCGNRLPSDFFYESELRPLLKIDNLHSPWPKYLNISQEVSLLLICFVRNIALNGWLVARAPETKADHPFPIAESQAPHFFVSLTLIYLSVLKLTSSEDHLEVETQFFAATAKASFELTASAILQLQKEFGPLLIALSKRLYDWCEWLAEDFFAVEARFRVGADRPFNPDENFSDVPVTQDGPKSNDSSDSKPLVSGLDVEKVQVTPDTLPSVTEATGTPPNLPPKVETRLPLLIAMNNSEAFDTNNLQEHPMVQLSEVLESLHKSVSHNDTTTSSMDDGRAAKILEQESVALSEETMLLAKMMR